MLAMDRFGLFGAEVLSLLYLKTLLLLSQVMYHEQEGMVMTKLLVIWREV